MESSLPPRMTTAELKKFCADFLEGRVFTSEHVQEPHLIPVVFGAAKGLRTAEPNYLEKVGLIWEHLDRAGAEMVKGYPRFLSHSTMHIDDWQKCREAIERCRAARTNLLDEEFK